MKVNPTQLAIISCIICFLVGGAAGYLVRSKARLTPKEFAHQLTRLDSRETGELIAVLERAWGISSTPPTIVSAEQKEK